MVLDKCGYIQVDSATLTIGTNPNGYLFLEIILMPLVFRSVAMIAVCLLYFG